MLMASSYLFKSLKAFASVLCNIGDFLSHSSMPLLATFAASSGFP